MHFPALDLVIEISSPSTESIDRHEKFIDYAAHRVKEYWIIDTVTNSVEKYLNDNGTFALQEKLKTGTVKSEVVKGFSLDLSTVFKRSLVSIFMLPLPFAFVFSLEEHLMPAHPHQFHTNRS